MKKPHHLPCAFWLLCICLYALPGYAQKEKYVERVDLTGIKLEIYQDTIDKSKLTTLDFRKTAHHKRFTFEDLERMAKELPPTLHYNVKATFINALTKSPIKGVKTYIVMGENLTTKKRHYLIFDELYKDSPSNKKRESCVEREDNIIRRF